MRIDLSKIEQQAEELRLLGLVISLHGETVVSRLWDIPCRRIVFSASKSFTACAVGFAVQEGLLRLEERLTDAFPEDLPPAPGEYLQAATVRDCLTMCLGQKQSFLMAATRMDIEEDDWCRAALRQPFDEQPGTHFVYSNAGPYLAGLLVQKRSGCDLVHYLMPRLFRPLGIKRPTWETDPLGRTFGASGLMLSIHELHKLGLFCLQQGAWNGRQLLKAGWITECSKKQADNGKEGYGYLFWRGAYNSYRADGMYGQFSIVLPDQDAVITITAESRHQDALLAFMLDELVPQL